MRNRRTLAFFCAATVLVMAGGCAGSGPYWSREDQGAALTQEREERIARLETQLANEQGRNAVLQAEVDRLGREVAQMRRAEAPDAALAAPPPEGLAAAETQPVPGTGARQEIEQSDLELADEPPAAADPPSRPPLAPAYIDTAATADPAEATNASLYERSLELLEQGRLTEAEAGFRRFLDASPDSDLADNAQFWLAESALRRADTAVALAGFRAVVESYPEGNKVPDALLKVGFCLAELGEPESAATVYRELLERFPETTAADTARQRLGLR